MTSSTGSANSQQTRSFPGWAAIIAGIAGLVAFACLTTYLMTLADTSNTSDTMPFEGMLLLAAADLSSALQALLMIPVALTLRGMGAQRYHAAATVALAMGCVGLLGIGVFRVLTVVDPAVFSGILFMGPTALVGAWLLAICAWPNGILPLWLRLIGIVAALGLLIVGASFFFLGGLAVLTQGPDAYGSNVEFHTGIAIGGPPGNILFAIWSIVIGIRLRRTSGG